MNKLYCGDCLDIMTDIPSGSIDMILCDLPYAVTARNPWDIALPFDRLWDAYERLIKQNAAVVLTATQPFATKLIMSNYKLFRYDLIWEKPMATGFLNANRMPLRSHEHILVFYKHLPTYNPQKILGKPYRMTRRSDTTNYNATKDLHYVTDNQDGYRFPKSVLKFSSDRNKLHPTQKPLALFEYLIKTYTNEGDIVLDSCAGSFTTAVASDNLKRDWICIEKEKKYCEIGLIRINENRSRLGLNLIKGGE